jgi:hypothetical protein
MRLLEIKEDGTLKFTKDLVNDKIPPYTILSHTWGEDEDEVTFKDIIENEATKKKGFEKIEFCRKQTTSDRLKYLWIDTCCIDKSNSTELAGAINSMFRWYQNAAMCYVYLVDVSIVKQQHKYGTQQGSLKKLFRQGKLWPHRTGVSPKTVWEASFRNSRWFTRGWTLQELIAPPNVEFFSLEGEYLGNKKSLTKLLHDITKIDVRAFQGIPLSTFSIEERISWSENRETQREEDMVYSLLGIVGVCMIPIYSEGRNNAMDRLQRKIKKLHMGREVGLASLHGELDLAKIYASIPIAKGATFDSLAEGGNRPCLEGTRVDLLAQIAEWAGNPNSKAIFWLNGMAGTGKSTISRTIAKSFADSSRLGASFFFKRGEADRGSIAKFVPTIAYQLVEQEPLLAPHVKNEVENKPSIFSKTIREQVDTLISKPISKLQRGTLTATALVVVVDALDECDRESDMVDIINILSNMTMLKPLSLRIFITSRPDLWLRRGFHAIRDKYQNIILHEIPKNVISSDISLFLENELSSIRTAYNATVPDDSQLEADWPGDSEIRTLINFSVPLFIAAATICRFIEDSRLGDPKSQLEEVLRTPPTGDQTSHLDEMYLLVLNKVLSGLPESSRNKVLQNFHQLVGPIVILFSPLSTDALARLLQVTKASVCNTLNPLHSILNVPNSSIEPVRLLHLSLRDFLLNSQKCGISGFWVDEKRVHQQLAKDCLQVMSCNLKTDICGLNDPGVLRWAIDSRHIDSCLLPETQYACVYWTYHMQQGYFTTEDGEEVLNFLKIHLLHWLEALSLMGKSSDSVDAITKLQSVTEV